MVQYLGEDKVKDMTPNHVRMRVGKHERTWVKNCCAIGLSSGFIEPLESTGLHFIFAAAAKLAEALQERYYNKAIQAGYDKFITDMLTEAKDFLVLHYALTNREDTDFWRAVKYETKISDSLAAIMNDARKFFPGRLKDSIIFPESSWVCVLAGMNYWPGFTKYNEMPQKEVIQQYKLLDKLAKLKQSVAPKVMNHALVVEKMCGSM